jgi:hypothetical protein
LLELVSEAVQSISVLEVSKFIGLHQGLDIVEGIIEDPITCAAESSSQHGDIDWHIILINIRRGQSMGPIFDIGEVET